MKDHALGLEQLLRHLIHTEPNLSHWMECGSVGRTAMEGKIDADNFRHDVDGQVIGLFLAIELLAKKCASFEQRITELENKD